ncbi:MAG TPA: adenylate kinase [Saprospiraceae bacterium]|nr:adenylate kinase [Saprospiraceae bacterium]
MLNLILFGPPGSGKGTQAEKLVSTYNLVHISTGNLFRDEIEAGTELGKQASGYMSRGELVPDEVTIGMLRNKMSAHEDANGFIFDGFPRTTPQAEALDALLEDMGQPIDALIMLDVPEDEIVKRLLLRGKESNRPDDRDEEVIRVRFQVYQSKTAPIYDYYDRLGKAYCVPGLGSIDHIFENLCETIDGLPA